MQRLPLVRSATDTGYVYVGRSGTRYKVGFSRTEANIRRRLRDCHAILVLCIPTGQRPSVLEYAINKRFSAKRLPSQGNKPGDKREWFALDQSDIYWLSGLAAHLNHNPLYAELTATESPKAQPVVY